MSYFLWIWFACHTQKEKIMITTKELIHYVGKEVQLEGFAERSKAGTFLIVDGQNIWLKNYDWSAAEYRQTVKVTGILKKGTDPLASFPVAKQDEHGAWSQGIGGYSDDLRPSEPLNVEGWVLSVSSVTVQPSK